jgi:hypothetical protein
MTTDTRAAMHGPSQEQPTVRDRLRSFEPEHFLRAQKLLASGTRPELDRPISTGADLPLRGDFILDPQPPRPPVVEGLEIEQAFEGHVVAVDREGELFVARLVDASSDAPDEEADFSFREVVPDDRHLVVPGALFTWTIGLEWRSRQSRRVSEIRFRRLPPFTAEAISQAEQEAVELSKLLEAQDAAEEKNAAGGG